MRTTARQVQADWSCSLGSQPDPIARFQMSMMDDPHEAHGKMATIDLLIWRSDHIDLCSTPRGDLDITRVGTRRPRSYFFGIALISSAPYGACRKGSGTRKMSVFP